MNVWVLVFTAIASLGGLSGIAAIGYISVTRRKIGAEARKIGVDADDVMSGRALEMYDRAMQEAREAKSEARGCYERLNASEDHADILERMLRDQGIVPPPFQYPLLTIGGDR